MVAISSLAHTLPEGIGTEVIEFYDDEHAAKAMWLRPLVVENV